MFSKTRKKIVISIMLVIFIVINVMLVVVYTYSYISLKKDNQELLKRYVGIYSLENLPSEGVSDGLPKDTIKGEADADLLLDDSMPDNLLRANSDDGDVIYKLSSFYSVSFSADDEVITVDEGRNSIYSRSDILETAREILKAGRKTGTISNFLYQVEQKDSYTLVAFMDRTLMNDSMKRLLINVLLGGIVSAIVLLFFAMFLARIIVKPLEENDENQRQFMSDIEHELKTPISIISANAELVHRELGDSKWLDNIQYENERMSKLVKELLEVSRAESIESTKEMADLSKIVEQEILPFEGVAFEQGLVINADITPGVMIFGNKCQLAKLISILLNNSIEHQEGGESIDISFSRDYKNAFFTIKNKADEIPEEKAKHLFERFYRVDEAREDDGGHYGLGLAIANAICQAHSGVIKVNSENGYVVFTVSLPVEKQ